MKKIDTVTYRLDALKWLVITGLLGAGFVVSYRFSTQPMLYLLLGWLVLLTLVTLIGIKTERGAALREFSRDSRIELRKVVWPSRQETVQTTLVVIAMILIASLILWGIDLIIMWAIAKITT
jgi:preprotein translocase subunit SecE